MKNRPQKKSQKQRKYTYLLLAKVEKMRKQFFNQISKVYGN